jgi:type III secretion system (T3SS) SseB-like protein
VRDLPDPGFAGDDGAASRAVTAALAGYQQDPSGGHAAALAVLQHERLLVPVVAVPGANGGQDSQGTQGADGGEKTTDMATVLTRGRDGRIALLAFTGSEAMRRWDPSARPVPVAVGTAAAAAVQDGATAMVLDVAGPVMLVVETEDLHELAQGSVLVRVSDRYAWVRPDR